MTTKRKTILKDRMSFKGSAAHDILCVLSSDKSLLTIVERRDAAPEMIAAAKAELARRDLLPDNYQI